MPKTAAWHRSVNHYNSPATSRTLVLVHGGNHNKWECQIKPQKVINRIQLSGLWRDSHRGVDSCGPICAHRTAAAREATLLIKRQLPWQELSNLIKKKKTRWNESVSDAFEWNNLQFFCEHWTGRQKVVWNYKLPLFVSRRMHSSLYLQCRHSLHFTIPR